MHRMNLDELSAWGMDLETELRRERRIELAGEGTYNRLLFLPFLRYFMLNFSLK